MSSPLFGYAGKLLRVDLTKERVSEEHLGEEMLRKYLGGTGLGAIFLYKEVSPHTEWSDPENRLTIASGPLGGTSVGGSGTISIVTKGALTNGATSSQANGLFGAYLKFCGFDGIIIQGVSEKWLYLHISDDHAELREADWLSGRDTYDTADLIKHELGKKEREMSVASIGPAGERFVRFSGISIDKGHVAAHNGVGAIMGSKRLKAIAVVRGKKRIPLKDKEKLSTVAKKLLNDVMTLEKDNYEWGTLKFLGANINSGIPPVKNYSTSIWSIEKDQAERFTCEYIRSNFDPKPNPCWACQLHHCHMMRIPDGPYAGEVAEEPEYEQLAAWGPLIDQRDISATVMLSKEVDRLGMDTNEAGWIVALIMECYEKRIISKKDLNGLEMNWGNAESARLLLNLIAKRQGIGDMLAEGVMRFAKKMGGDFPNLAIHTMKGNTPRGHDHRKVLAEQFDTCVSSTGTIETILRFYGKQVEGWKDISTAVAETKGAMQFEDSLGVCRFNTRMNVRLLSEAVSAATGWDFTWDEGMRAGRRFINLLRAFNIRLGMTREQDRPSPRYGSTPIDGPAKGLSMIPHWDQMLENYYRLMGWDVETGKPLPETLGDLGLEDVVKDIWQ